MLKNLSVFLVFAIFLASCKEASFNKDEGLKNTSFDVLNQVTEEHRFSLFNQTETHGVFITSASYNNQKLYISGIEEEDEDEDTERFKFQNYILAYSKNNNSDVTASNEEKEGEENEVVAPLDLYITPYLSQISNLNKASTALYLFIYNSLPYEEFSNLEIGESKWNTLLREYQNTCETCLNKSLSENIDVITTDDYFWFKIKREINEDLSWEKKPLKDWNWLLIETNPSLENGNRVRLAEGTEIDLNACVYHPSLVPDCHDVTYWEHDIVENGSLVRTEGSELSHEIAYDKNENLTYTINFGIESDTLPDVMYTIEGFISNTNRPALLSQSLPEITIFAGQEARVNLLNYFEDPDNPSESLVIVPEETTDLLQFIYPSDLLVYRPATPFNIGEHEFRFRVRDSLNLESQIFTVNVTILENTPPTILHAYKNEDKSTLYQDNDIVEFVEGEENQFLTIVAEDENGDRTKIRIENDNTIRHNYSYDPSHTFGVINPRNSGWNFNYGKSGFLFYSPGDELSEQRFEIRPSYYQVTDRDNRTYTLDFKVTASDSVEDPSGPTYAPIELTSIEQDEFRIRVRVVNYDDPPVSPGTLNAPSVDEGQELNVEVSSLFTPADSAYNPSTVRVVSVGSSISTSCDWLSATSTTLSGTPPFDSNESCSVNYRLYDSANSLHGSDRAPSDLRTSDFTINIPINNVNNPPQIMSGLSTDLGTYIEGELFEIPLMDIRPTDAEVAGHFYDMDLDLSDPENTFVDPLDEFYFTCEVSVQGENDFAPCTEQGLEFIPNGNEWAAMETKYDLVQFTDSVTFDVRLGFKDNFSSYIYKDLTLTVENKAAPVQVNFEESAVYLNEENLRATKVVFSRFSEDPIDVYPFKLNLDCLSCQEIITSHGSEIFYNGAADESRNYFEITVILEPDYTHGNGDGGKQTYLVNAQTESLAKSYSDPTPHEDDITSLSPMILEVYHVNKSPHAIEIEGDQNDRVYNIDVDKKIKGNALETYSLNVLDVDPQDVNFNITAANIENGGLIEFNGVSLSLNYLKCPLGGQVYDRTVTLQGFDESGASVTRDVRVRLRNVDTNSINCR